MEWTMNEKSCYLELKLQIGLLLHLISTGCLIGLTPPDLFKRPIIFIRNWKYQFNTTILVLDFFTDLFNAGLIATDKIR